MASLKELRNRIASVKATQKITKAMQMVAAAKLRRAQEAAEAARPFAENMQMLLTSVAHAMKDADSAPLLLKGTGSEQVHLLLVCTAERGLCGAFNSSISRLARERARTLKNEGKTVKILCVGRKGYDVLKREFQEDILETIDLRAVKSIAYNDAANISARVLEMFEAGEFDVCSVLFGEFKSVLVQEPRNMQIIPAHFEEQEEDDGTDSAVFYEYEPDEQEVLQDLLPRNITVQIFRVLLENAASEQGARMTAMDNATRNAGEMIDKLTLQYNRSRQAMITKELIEIISGAEAL